MPPDKGKFYEFIMTAPFQNLLISRKPSMEWLGVSAASVLKERLRGTSRLFRFQKSLIKPPQSRSQKRGPSAVKMP